MSTKFWIFLNFKHIHTFMKSFWRCYLPRFLLARNWWVAILQWCIHLQKLMGSWEPIKLVLWGSWYFNENYYPFLWVIKGTFNHLLGTEITRVILSRNRVGTENRVLWKVGFKLIPITHSIWSFEIVQGALNLSLFPRVWQNYL